jgi:hypothetical protein
MFETFSRSWDITKTTFSVMKSDKEVLLFPVLSAVFSLVFFALMAVPFLLSSVLEQVFPGILSSVLYLVVVFFLYFGLTFIATFFNVGVVFIAKTRFEGGDAGFTDALGAAISRIHLILLWSIVSATVGTLLRVIEGAGGKQGSVGRIITGLIAGILGFLWGIVTLFVVPSMVFNNTGPFAALKDSVDVIKKTWGESLVRHYGLGFAQALVVFVLFVPFFLLAIVVSMVNWALLIPVVLAFVGVVIIVSILFSTANTIFNTALYWYAKTGQVPGAYSPEVMQNAFVQKKGLF